MDTTRHFMRLAYRGAPFHGWQTQPHDASVQQTLEEALTRIVKTPVAVTGAGRTDAGVNARLMVAHMDLPATFAMPPERLAHALDTMVGPDIAIRGIYPMHPGAHARFDATSRTYRYFASTVKTPFLHHLTWFTPRPLDFEAMNRAAELLLTTDDFTSFAKLHSDAKTNICRVSRACWEPDPAAPGLWRFEITADRFLRNMVRAVVGTLVEVGRGKLSLEGFGQVIRAHDRCCAGTSMPPHPLFLWDVTYPYPIPSRQA